MIHDGTAESGHYYSFIFDKKNDAWWRFNDHTVSLECEETVMLEAFGGQKNSCKSAYALMYVNHYVQNQIK
jgi:ubiquitin carboxyl-terminal hydrolase 25/28